MIYKNTWEEITMKKSLMTAFLLSLLLVCGCSAADENSSREKDTANIEKWIFRMNPKM